MHAPSGAHGWLGRWSATVVGLFSFSIPAFAQAAEPQASGANLAEALAVANAQTLRSNLIAVARADDPNGKLANWYAGRVESDGRWFTPDEINRQAAADPLRAKYRQRRDALTDDLAGHERLARWCEKQGLVDLAHLHWLHVLRFAPEHAAALSALELQWQDGLLLTTEEAERYAENLKAGAKQEKLWRRKAVRLRRELEQNEPDRQIAAMKELSQIDEPAAVPALIEEFTRDLKSEQEEIARHTDLIEGLGGIDAPTAVGTLAEMAVYSDEAAVRAAAVYKLKSKPLEDVLPALLSHMEMPIESSVSINTIGNQVVNHYTYTQEGADGRLYEKQYTTSRYVPGQRFLKVPIYLRKPRHLVEPGYWKPGYTIPPFWCGGHMTHERYVPPRYVNPKYDKPFDEYFYLYTNSAEAPGYARNRALTENASRNQAESVSSNVAQRNDLINAKNEHVADVLTELTGAELNAFPKSWWNWWGKYLDEHPEMAARGARQQLNLAQMNQTPRGLARGTWVWTRLGRKPVEEILPGDFVLAQDPESGELAYRVVLRIAEPRPLEVVKLAVGNTSLHLSPGHVAWVAGAGWRKIDSLVPGKALHGVNQEVVVGETTKAFTIDCFDLIVDDFHTLLVGKSGLLVHDATPIGPAYQALPGFSPTGVAQAVKLASN